VLLILMLVMTIALPSVLLSLMGGLDTLLRYRNSRLVFVDTPPDVMHVFAFFFAPVKLVGAADAFVAAGSGLNSVGVNEKKSSRVSETRPIQISDCTRRA
jgi:hypothetical protein